MIQLDANYLIFASLESSEQAGEVRRWLEAGESLGTNAIAWMEFVTGPVTPEEVASIRLMINDRINEIGREEAELAAQLYHRAGRKRALRFDCLIAAAAIRSGSRLATGNRPDFAVFLAEGLQLANK
jgi:predicted nucleic acid-binding protein